MDYKGVIMSTGNELKHWKYIKKEKVNGKWRYYYNVGDMQEDMQKAKEQAKEQLGLNAKQEMQNSKSYLDKSKAQESSAKSKYDASRKDLLNAKNRYDAAKAKNDLEKYNLKSAFKIMTGDKQEAARRSNLNKEENYAKAQYDKAKSTEKARKNEYTKSKISTSYAKKDYEKSVKKYKNTPISKMKKYVDKGRNKLAKIIAVD